MASGTFRHFPLCQVGWDSSVDSYFQVSLEMFDWLQVRLLAGHHCHVGRWTFGSDWSPELPGPCLYSGYLWTLIHSTFPQPWPVSLSLLLKNNQNNQNNHFSTKEHFSCLGPPPLTVLVDPHLFYLRLVAAVLLGNLHAAFTRSFNQGLDTPQRWSRAWRHMAVQNFTSFFFFNKFAINSTVKFLLLQQRCSEGTRCPTELKVMCLIQAQPPSGVQQTVSRQFEPIRFL